MGPRQRGRGVAYTQRTGGGRGGSAGTACRRSGAAAPRQACGFLAAGTCGLLSRRRELPLLQRPLALALLSQLRLNPQEGKRGSCQAPGVSRGDDGRGAQFAQGQNSHALRCVRTPARRSRLGRSGDKRVRELDCSGAAPSPRSETCRRAALLAARWQGLAGKQQWQLRLDSIAADLLLESRFRELWYRAPRTLR